MGQLTAAAPAADLPNPYAPYASAVPDPYASGQSGGQGGWLRDMAVSTYPSNPHAAEAGQHSQENPRPANEYQTHGTSNHYQKRPADHNDQGKRDTQGPRH